MPLQNFVDNSLPTIKAAWLNALDSFYTTLFAEATTPAAARAALGSTAVGGFFSASCERCMPRLDGVFLFCCTAMTYS